MGKRKSRVKLLPKKRMDAVFSCPFCNHGNHVECRMQVSQRHEELNRRSLVPDLPRELQQVDNRYLSAHLCNTTGLFRHSKIMLLPMFVASVVVLTHTVNGSMSFNTSTEPRTRIKMPMVSHALV